MTDKPLTKPAMEGKIPIYLLRRPDRSNLMTNLWHKVRSALDNDAKFKNNYEASAKTADQMYEMVDSGSVSPSAIFVTDELESPLFNFLSANNCYILAPLVIMYCKLSPKLAFPKSTEPVVLSLCMRNLKISISGIVGLTRSLKEDFESKIVNMSGTFESGLSRKTSYLVANSVCTDIYKLAVQLQIPVMTLEWVNRCFNDQQYEFKEANQETYIAKYKLPILHGLTIYLSQFDDEEREHYIELIKSNGGKYREYTPATAATDSNSQVKEISDTILLLKWKKGSLYSRMMPLNVPCLTIDWLTESIETQYCLLFAGYDIHCDEIQDNFGQFLDEPPIELKWSGLPAEPTFEGKSEELEENFDQFTPTSK